MNHVTGGGGGAALVVMATASDTEWDCGVITVAQRGFLRKLLRNGY